MKAVEVIWGSKKITNGIIFKVNEEYVIVICGFHAIIFREISKGVNNTRTKLYRTKIISRPKLNEIIEDLIDCSLIREEIDDNDNRIKKLVGTINPIKNINLCNYYNIKKDTNF